MREQVRIYKHIQEYKTEKNKKSTDDTPKVNTGNYFSSRIVKKIAEDHIHHSLKEIQAATMAQTGGLTPKQPSRTLHQAKS